MRICFEFEQIRRKNEGWMRNIGEGNARARGYIQDKQTQRGKWEKKIEEGERITNKGAGNRESRSYAVFLERPLEGSLLLNCQMDIKQTKHYIGTEIDSLSLSLSLSLSFLTKGCLKRKRKTRKIINLWNIPWFVWNVMKEWVRKISEYFFSTNTKNYSKILFYFLFFYKNTYTNFNVTQVWEREREKL